jgi:hypothetical protein
MRIKPALLILLFASFSFASDPPTSRPAAPRVRVFVLEGHASMMEHVGAAKLSLSQEMDHMPDGSRFDIIFEKKHFRPALVAMDDDIRGEVQQFAASLAVSGSGRDDLALLEALKMRPAEVWFLSDGNVEGDKQAGLAAEVAFARNANIPINTVFFCDRPNPQADPLLVPLWDLAAATGGRCVLGDGSAAKDPRVKPRRRPPTSGPSIFGD